MRIRIWPILAFMMYAVPLAFVSMWMGKQAPSWFPVQAAAESHLIDELFSFLVMLGSFIFLGVTGVLAYSLLFHRAAADDNSDGPPIEGDVALEVVWTVIPVLLVFWIASYSYQIYNQMGIRGSFSTGHSHVPMGMEAAFADTTTSESAVTKPTQTIDVIAKQWAWVFRYPYQNVTSTELHLPVNQRVHLALKSEDVLHGFYVPAFRLKQDIVPSETIDLEFTPILEGKYSLTDSQFSGTYFAAMNATVVVESEEDYQNWLQKAANNMPSPAPNQAVSEYAQAAQLPVKNGWITVKPAPAPVVNFSGY
ncbi:MAG: cytochrome c oxidase subunit II [Calothrix sp. SM1_7_51]|nr:cytochrome c oxidase subunit II [Calothrix sp. SM1_7_51]